MQRIEVITGEERRRVWTEEKKDEILAAAFAPGASVTAVARRYDMTKATIYRWRIERSRPKGLAQVLIRPEAAAALPASAPSPQKFIDIVLGADGSIRIPLDTPADLASAVLKAAFGR